MSGSNHAVIEISRSKKRYQDQDALLKGFIGCEGFTAKEVAVEVLDWKYEPYANSPKRAFDLQRLGYLALLPGRVCRQTNKQAHSYKITDKGYGYLRAKGYVLAPSASITVQVTPSSMLDGKSAVNGLRSLLG